MNIARDGLLFVGIALLVTAGAFALALQRRSWSLWVLAFSLTVLTLAIAWFFRDPERSGERGAHLIVSPADGRLVEVREVDEPAFLQGRAIRMSIFMNVFDVHVNRYPVSGTVRYLHYTRGRFFSAATEKSSLENEQMSVGIETAHHRILVRQIAGLLARRVVTWAREGEEVEQGARLGLIRFGSRVDVFLPADATVRAGHGEATVAGVTVLAELPTA